MGIHNNNKSNYRDTKKALMKKRKRRELIRGPKSAWIFFIQEKYKSTETGESRSSTTTQKQTFSDLCHKWSPVWKELSNSDKAKFQEMNNMDKERYKKELAGLTQDEREDVIRSSKKKRTTRSPGLPKPVRSAYIWFVLTERTNVMQENPGLSFAEVGKELGKRWNLLSQEKRDMYYDMNLQDKQRYLKEKSGLQQQQNPAGP